MRVNCGALPRFRLDNHCRRGRIHYSIHMRVKCAFAIVAGFVYLGCCVLTSGFGNALAALAESAAIDQAAAEPPVLTSSNHLLDLLVIAEPTTITLGDRHPVAWVFEICPRAVAQE